MLTKVADGTSFIRRVTVALEMPRAVFPVEWTDNIFSDAKPRKMPTGRECERSRSHLYVDATGGRN
jgi:hypothetical protein